MKYAIIEGNTTTEFLTYNLAVEYCNSRGLLISDIFSVEDSPVIGPSKHEIFMQNIRQGYNISGSSYYLGLEDTDRAQFQGMLLLVNEALSLGMITTSSMQTIVDKNKNSVQMTALEFKQLMVGYGFYYKTIWDQARL